jgi:hypothetical protein
MFELVHKEDYKFRKQNNTKFIIKFEKSIVLIKFIRSETTKCPSEATASKFGLIGVLVT